MPRSFCAPTFGLRDEAGPRRRRRQSPPRSSGRRRRRRLSSEQWPFRFPPLILFPLAGLDSAASPVHPTATAAHVRRMYRRRRRRIMQMYLSITSAHTTSDSPGGDGKQCASRDLRTCETRLGARERCKNVRTNLAVYVFLHSSYYYLKFFPLSPLPRRPSSRNTRTPIIALTTIIMVV